MLFQLLDADYMLNANKPIVRLFGKTEQGNSVCVFCEDFKPYFYARHGFKAPEISSAADVEKFIPIGFRKKPDTLVKLTLNNPQDVARVRDEMEMKGIETYEADILFKYRFLVDNGLKGMQWVSADCAKTFTKTVKCPAYNAKSVEPVDKKENCMLRHMAFDIECIPADVTKPLNSKSDPIVIIALAFEPSYKDAKTLVLAAKPVTGKGVQGFDSEKGMIQAFLSIVESYDPDIITGYNINSFDVPYLLDRLDKNGLPKNFGRANDKSVYTQTFGMVQDTNIPGRIVVDPYQLLRRDPWTKFHRYDLNTVAKALLNEEKHDVEYSEMPALWNGPREELMKFIEYARKDAELSLRLVLEKRMLDKFLELSKLSGVLLQDAFGGQSQRIEIMLLHEFKNRNYVMPTKPSKAEMARRVKERDKQGLQGATVLEPKKGLHSDGCTLVLDFKSLYPSLMRAYNISPDTLVTSEANDDCEVSPTGARFVKEREGVLPYVLKTLLDTRQHIKKLMKNAKGEERRLLNAKQLAVKDISNSMYGYTGYIRARLYVIDVAASITAYGRENIEKTKKLVEENFPVEVVYGDTDSLLLKTKLTNLDDARELGGKISKFVTDKNNGKLQLDFEKIYRTFLILTKKRYAAWKFYFDDNEWKDEIEMKGIETIRRDWCRLVTETMTAVLVTILKEGDVQKSISLLRSVVEKLKKNEVPLEKLTVVKGITKSVESYEGMLPHIELAKKLAARNPEGVHIGDRVGYVIIKGNQLLSKRAEDPAYARKHNLAIDSDYYINSQLFPPIERILASLGITKSELLGSGRQFSLADVVNGSKKRTKQEIEVSYAQREEPPREAVLEGCEGFVCKKCQRSHRRIPLQGVCECGGELLISYQGSVGTKMVKK